MHGPSPPPPSFVFVALNRPYPLRIPPVSILAAARCLPLRVFRPCLRLRPPSPAPHPVGRLRLKFTGHTNSAKAWARRFAPGTRYSHYVCSCSVNFRLFSCQFPAGPPGAVRPFGPPTRDFVNKFCFATPPCLSPVSNSCLETFFYTLFLYQELNSPAEKLLFTGPTFL